MIFRAKIYYMLSGAECGLALLGALVGHLDIALVGVALAAFAYYVAEHYNKPEEKKDGE